MIQDLDKTLENLLNDPAAPVDVRAAEVRFQTPDKTFSPAQSTAALNLFLYDMKENRELRDPVPIVEKQGNVYVSRRPPLRVDCHYMVTAWADPNKAAEDKVKDEHQLLSNTCLWLSRFPTIPSQYFAGSLAGPPSQPFPPPTLVAQMNGKQNLGEFWSALGVSPKPLFNIVVTIAMDLKNEVEGPLVTTAIAGYQQGEDIATQESLANLGGVVRNAVGKPVPDVWVSLEPTSLVAISDSEGRFLFVQVPLGTNYTLRARAVGLGEISRNVEIPSLSGEYNMQFP